MRCITQIYRRIFGRKGYGVHSPFVFDLITNVIEEKCAYYSYADVSRIRTQLSKNNGFVNYRGKRISVKKAVQRFCILRKEGEFLFRLTNRYKPRKILAIGSSLGLTPLYLSRYNSLVQCITLECESDFAEIAAHLLNKEANPLLQIRTGLYHELLPESLSQLKQVDCLFISKDIGINDSETIFEQCLPFVHDKTVCVWAGIHSSSEKVHHWKQICQHPKVTVAVDLFQLGLLFFQPKLHKRVYKTIVP